MSRSISGNWLLKSTFAGQKYPETSVQMSFVSWQRATSSFSHGGFERRRVHVNGLQEVLMLLSETVGQTTAAHAKRVNIFSQRGPADSFSSLHARPGREGGAPQCPHVWKSRDTQYPRWIKQLV